MAEQARILILGGYGVFGRQLAAEILQRTSALIIIAGRSKDQALRCCRALGRGRTEALRLDVDDISCASKAFDGCTAVICAAGPFQQRDCGLPLLAARRGAHWLDISDCKRWVIELLASKDLQTEAAAHSVIIVPGLSTVPAISGAMVRLLLRDARPAAKARVILYIANRNPKGTGAIHSALQSGFSDPVLVDLPWGRKRAYRFESPDEELIPREFGLEAEFRVSFELKSANAVIHWAQHAGPALKRYLAGILHLASGPFSRWGSNLSCLKVELLDDKDQICAECSLIDRGQKLAVLPCVFAVESLLRGELESGVVNPVTWLAPEVWLDKLCSSGIEFWKPKQSRAWLGYLLRS